MGERSITSTLKIDGEQPVVITEDWSVEFKGHKYIMPLREPQGAKENTNLNATIDLTFQHWAIYQLKSKPFFTVQSVDSNTVTADKYDGSVQLNLGGFCSLLSQVLAHTYGDKITIDLNPAFQYDKEVTTVEITHTFIWDVVTQLYPVYGVRWSIEAAESNSNTVKNGERYIIRVGYAEAELNHIFEYGFKGGLLKVERQVQSEEIRNMILGRGGDINLPMRYFKGKDAQNPGYAADPDACPELANIYFDKLRGATFRSYIQGWNAKHHGGVYNKAESYAPWAWEKGYTDSRFDPVEYVKDDESILKYGERLGWVDDDEDIYPSIQGSGMDIAVDVEKIVSDDVIEAAESDAYAYTLGAVEASKLIKKGQEVVLEVDGDEFTVEEGKTANLEDLTKTVASVTEEQIRKRLYRVRGSWAIEVQTMQVPVDDTETELVTLSNASIRAVNTSTGEVVAASGLSGGTYRPRLKVKVHNTANKDYTITVRCEGFKVTSATLGDRWTNTFDVWVKNIWNTSKASWETDSQYSERVWKPILGDKVGSEAKMAFATGLLATGDYEFVITEYPSYDTSKVWEEKDSEGNIMATHTSQWRVRLAKSDADVETTGKYVPNTIKQGYAGDKFVFTGIDMPYAYVIMAEKRLDDLKKEALSEVAAIKPTWVVSTDRVRLGNYGNAGALIDQLRAGSPMRLADKRFILNEDESQAAYATLYITSLKYTYREPTSDDAALNPDVEMILSDEYAGASDPISTIQGELSALQKQVGAASNIAQIARAVGDKLYLRKDGIADRSMSPTEFASSVNSTDFLAGALGGIGWGIFKDENGNWVLETDKINVRQEIHANTLVINQAEGRIGMEVDTAALIKVNRVEAVDDGYKCYFDQKEGTIANNFRLGDIGYSVRYSAQNNVVSSYRRKVVAVGDNYIILSDSIANGSGIPMVDDVIIHYGSYTDADRRFVKVRDVIGGGYERYIEGLDSVSAVGTEYYFIGRQTGQYGGKPRWYVGSEDSHIEFKEGKFTLSGVSLSVGTTIGETPIEQYISKAASTGVTNLVKKSDETPEPTVVVWTGEYCKAYPYELSEALKVGEDCVVSVWGEADGFDGMWIDVASGEITASRIRLEKVNNNLWRARATIRIPYLTSRAVVFRVPFGDSADPYGFTIHRVKIERGRNPTDWSPAPSDYKEVADTASYLKRALQESTTVTNGLIMTSLIELGYTDETGQYSVQSGINGIYERNKPGGGIALWAGGKAVDYEELDHSLGAPDVPFANAVFRMNGTGYLAGHTLRFNRNNVELGDNMVLTDNELRVLTPNGMSLSITGGEMTYSSLGGMRANATIDYGLETLEADLVWHSGSTSQSYYMSVVFPKVAYGRREIPMLGAGTALRVVFTATLDINFGTGPGTVIPTPTGRIIVKLRDASTLAEIEGVTFEGATWLLSPDVLDPTLNRRRFHVNYDHTVNVPSAGLYAISIESIDAYAGEDAGYKTTHVIQRRAKTIVDSTQARQFVASANGIAANWGGSLFVVDDDGAALRRGNRWIRLTDSGIFINRGSGEVAL